LSRLRPLLTLGDRDRVDLAGSASDLVRAERLGAAEWALAARLRAGFTGLPRVAQTLPAMTDGQKEQQLGEYALDYVLKARLLGEHDASIIDAVSQAIGKSAT
jgi:hypothetical protein